MTKKTKQSASREKKSSKNEDNPTKSTKIEKSTKKSSKNKDKSTKSSKHEKSTKKSSKNQQELTKPSTQNSQKITQISSQLPTHSSKKQSNVPTDSISHHTTLRNLIRCKIYSNDAKYSFSSRLFSQYKHSHNSISSTFNKIYNQELNIRDKMLKDQISFRRLNIQIGLPVPTNSSPLNIYETLTQNYLWKYNPDLNGFIVAFDNINVVSNLLPINPDDRLTAELFLECLVTVLIPMVGLEGCGTIRANTNQQIESNSFIKQNNARFAIQVLWLDRLLINIEDVESDSLNDDNSTLQKLRPGDIVWFKITSTQTISDFSRPTRSNPQPQASSLFFEIRASLLLDRGIIPYDQNRLALEPQTPSNFRGEISKSFINDEEMNLENEDESSSSSDENSSSSSEESGSDYVEMEFKSGYDRGAYDSRSPGGSTSSMSDYSSAVHAGSISRSKGSILSDPIFSRPLTDDDDSKSPKSVASLMGEWEMSLTRGKKIERFEKPREKGKKRKRNLELEGSKKEKESKRQRKHASSTS